MSQRRGHGDLVVHVQGAPGPRSAIVASRRTAHAARILAAPHSEPYGKQAGGVRPLYGWEPLVSTPIRPGVGGRRPRVAAGFVSQATRQLREELGEPQVHSSGGAQLLVWQVDDGGDGLLCARLSAQDIQKGETAMGQVHVTREMADRIGLRPKYVLVGMQMSGKQPYERRLDFAFIQDKIATEPISWVAYRHPDRIARHQLPAELFYHHLEATKTDLYLSAFGGKVDWRADRMQLLMLGVFSEHEAGQIRDRTHSALQRRFLEEGRGWPASVRFGFRRNAQRYLEVDPEQWQFVERIHYDYATLHEDGRGSIRRLVEHLAQLGCKLSYERTRQILRDPIYVTGEWSVTHQGVEYPGRRIDLARPIPRQIFERNQALLATTRGKYSRNPYGYHLLNHIPVLHARCMDTGVDAGKRARARKEPVNQQPRLRASAPDPRAKNPGPPGFKHWPATPECCKGWSIPSRPIEHAVIRELLRLAESPELQRAWTMAAREERTERFGTLTTSQRETITARIANLERQRQRVHRDWLDRVADGDDTASRYLQESVESIDAEIAGYRRRLEVSDAVEAGRRAKERAALARASDRESLLARLREVLTLDPPDDPDLRQRRVAFVSSVLSAVVVHDDQDGEIRVELYGELVPQSDPAVAVDPLSKHGHLLEESPAGPTLTTKSALGGQLVDAAPFGDLVAAWRSPRIAVDATAREFAKYPAILDGLRKASGQLPPGRMFGRDWRGTGELLHASGLPRTCQFLSLLHSQGLRVGDVLREALGDEALRLNRVAVESREEVVTVLSWALSDGVLDGTVPLPQALNRQRGYLPAYRALARVAGREGTTVGELYVEAQRRLGWRWPVLVREAPDLDRQLADLVAGARRDWLSPAELGAVSGFSAGSVNRWLRGALPYSDGDPRNPWSRGAAPVDESLGRLRRRIAIERLSAGFVHVHVDLTALAEVLGRWPAGWREAEVRRALAG